MHKVTATEFANPHARVRRECEETVISEKAAYAAESESLSKENEKLSRDWEKLSASWKAKRIDEATFVKKGKAIEERYKNLNGRTVLLQKRQDSIISALNKQIASYDAEIGDSVQKQRALTSLLIGTGRGTAAIQLLHDSFGDYANSTDRAEKHRIAATIRQIYDSASEFNPINEVPSVLSDLDRIEDPEQRTAFYRQNREAIHGAYSEQQLKALENEAENS